jgi:uncharacterized pyridoxamine 5'-phosphate oxidase family protein
MNMADKQTILDFLHDHPLAVISTASNNKPQSAVVAFAELDSLELIFETFIGTRKYKNLQKNNWVSLAIGWNPKMHITVQYEGTASEVGEKEVEEYIKVFLAKDTPCTEEFLRHGHGKLFKVKPKWIRYSDYTGLKPKIVEGGFS